MTKSVWKGPSSYLEDDWLIFSGRDADLDRLEHSFHINSYTLLIGQSGIGKSSLLRAGLYSKIIPFNIQPIHISLDSVNINNFQTALDSVMWIIKDKLSYLRPDIKVAEPISYKGFNGFINSIIQSCQPRLPIFIFDQFEQVFIQGSQKENRRELNAFLAVLSNFIEKRNNEHLDYHCIIGAREDYYFRFDNIRHFFPTYDSKRLRINPLTGTEALQATLTPVMHSSEPRILDSNKAKAIVQNVTEFDDKEFVVVYQDKWQYQALDIDSYPSRVDWSMKRISPWILSLYCSGIESELLLNYQLGVKTYNLPQVDSVLGTHFKDSIGDLSFDAIVLLTELISHDGNSRISMDLERFLSNSDHDNLHKLIKRQIIRIENFGRLGNQIHLIHDIFIPSILDKRRELEEERERSQVRIKARKMVLLTAVISIFIAGSIILSLQWNANIKIKSEREIALEESTAKSLYFEALQNADRNPTLSLALTEYASRMTNQSPYSLSIVQQLYINHGFSKTLGNSDFTIYSTNTIDKHIYTVITDSPNVILKKTGLNSGQEWSWKLPNEHLKPYSLDIAPNRKLAAVGFGDGLIYLVDLEKEGAYKSLEKVLGDDRIFNLEFSPKGNKLLAAGLDNRGVAIYDLNNPAKSIKLDANSQHGSTVYAVAFGKGARSVYSTGADGVLKKWNMDGSLEEDLYVHPTHFFFDLDLSANGDKLLLACSDGRLYELDTLGKMLQEYTGATNALKYSCSYSPDGNYVAAGDRLGKAWLWHCSGELLQEYIGEEGKSVWESELSTNNRYLITGGEDQKVKKWSTSGIMLGRYGQSTQVPIVGALGWQADRHSDLFELKVSGYGRSDNSLLYSINGDLPEILIDGAEYISLARAANGKVLIAQNSPVGKQLRVLDESLNEIGHLNIAGDFQTLHIHPQGNMVYFNRGNTLMEWDISLEHPSEFYTFKDKHGAITQIATSVDGKRMALGRSNGSFHVLDLSSEHPVVVYEQEKVHDEWISALTFSRDGTTLVTASLDGSISVWNLTTKKLETKCSSAANGAVYGLGVSADNNVILARHDSKKALLYDIGNGFTVQEFNILNNERAAVVSAAFSQDEKTVILQYTDGITRTWEIREPWQSFIEGNDFDKLSQEELDKILAESLAEKP